MKLWPQSLFARLALLLLAAMAVALVVTILLFHQDRANLVARQFGDTVIVRLQAIRAALEAVEPREQRDTVRRIAREYNVALVPEDERRGPMGAPASPRLAELERRLQAALGEGTVVRIQPRLQLLWVRIAAGANGYWVAFPLPPRTPAADMPSRAAIWSAVVASCLLLAAFLFARYLARPLRELHGGLLALGRGDTPQPLPDAGPSEIASLNRAFNRTLASLRQLDQDRALLLAGISHDLRTPLARLRLGLEMSVQDESARRGMADDIEEMDRIIGQFLDFARHEEDSPPLPQDPNAIVAAAVERYQRAGKDVRFSPGIVQPVPLRGTAFSRMVANLIDNALAYGRPPVEVATHETAGRCVLDVIDHGPGIPPDDVERLKQPFTRASVARTHAGGIAGAGLGLAIVERIARLHGGTFSIMARDGGGTIAHVEFPAGSAA